jgi:predicted membrane channel-forming protein YqfA (hemolysin III family)
MKRILLAFAAVGICAIAIALPRIPQDPNYHLMADTKAVAGIPNAADVFSNAAFLIVGGLGLIVMGGARQTGASHGARGPWLVFFIGTAATALGSSYYHLQPDNGRLLWDRLPMAVAFASLLTAVMAERVDGRLGRVLFVPLLVVAVASVAFWYWSESAGRGDLRPYVTVQFGTLLLLVTILALYPHPAAETRLLVAGLIAYALAKVFELLDAPIYLATHFLVSGHTLKHLAAAAGVGCVLWMLRVRRT